MTACAPNKLSRATERALRRKAQLARLAAMEQVAATGSLWLDSRAVCALCAGISLMALWRWTRERGFPPPDAIVGQRKYWRRATVHQWQEEQIAATAARNAAASAPQRRSRKAQPATTQPVS